MRRNMALGPGLALVAVLAFSVPAAAQINAGAVALQIAPSPQADGMGTAYTAIASDAYATWWNPAGLSFLGEDLRATEARPSARSIAVTFSQLVPDLFNDVYYSYLAYSQKLGEWSGIGVSIPFITYGEIPIMIGEGQERGTHVPNEFAAVFGYGTRLRQNMGIGASVKVYRSDLSPEVPEIDLREPAIGTTFAVDLGFLYRTNAIPLSLGVSMLNLGPDISFVKTQEASPLPRVLKVGAAYTIYSDGTNRLLGAADFTKPFIELRDEPIYGGGLEYSFAWGQSGNIALRAGYFSEREGDVEDPTFGLGIGFSGFRYDFVSFPQSSELGYVSRHSVQFAW